MFRANNGIWFTGTASTLLWYDPTLQEEVVRTQAPENDATFAGGVSRNLAGTGINQKCNAPRSRITSRSCFCATWCFTRVAYLKFFHGAFLPVPRLENWRAIRKETREQFGKRREARALFYHRASPEIFVVSSRQLLWRSSDFSRI